MDPPPQPASPAHSPGPACAECGYDLRGVEPGDTCPECGRARAIGLTRREAVLVGVRVVAVCLVLNSLLLLDTLAWLAIDSLVALLTGGPSVASGVADPTFFVLQAAPLGVRVALAALLWWQSRRLAKRLVPHDGPVFAGTGPAAADLLSVGLILVGVTLAISAVPALLVPLVRSLSPDTPPLPSGGPIAEAAVRLVLGVALAPARPLHRRLSAGLALVGDDFAAPTPTPPAGRRRGVMAGRLRRSSSRRGGAAPAQSGSPETAPPRA